MDERSGKHLRARVLETRRREANNFQRTLMYTPSQHLPSERQPASGDDESAHSWLHLDLVCGEFQFRRQPAEDEAMESDSRSLVGGEGTLERGDRCRCRLS
jgi:hypothetical protein